MSNTLHGFFRGIARVLDIGNTWSHGKNTDTPAHKDLRALHTDWDVVARDIDTAMDTLGMGTVRVKRQASSRTTTLSKENIMSVGKLMKSERIKHPKGTFVICVNSTGASVSVQPKARHSHT